MTRAVYAGTFDPLTFGHLDIISRAAEVFDELIVATTDNLEKQSLFSLEERLSMLRQVLNDRPGLEVQPFNGLLVHYAREIGANVLVRGLRAAADFDYEFEMGLMNRELEQQIETVFFLTRPKYMFVSSTLIKEIARKGGDIRPFVPRVVQDAIINKLGRR
ncbi:pantetheine-phosphate adenylyltransferase [bacterium]|nr:pantetheine-phosphate adenylyltransferase [bacterium]